MVNSSMTKEGRIYRGEKTVSLISGAVKTGQLHVKKMKLEHSLTPYTFRIKDLNVRLNAVKLLEENVGRTLFDINHSNIFLDPSPKTKEIKAKINKWDLMKRKSFCTAKETINKKIGRAHV